MPLKLQMEAITDPASHDGRKRPQQRFSMTARAWLISLAGLLQPSHAERVTVAYEAEVGTVTGQPFGITVPRLTTVKGYITYETSTIDLRPADPMRGDFLMQGTWDFRAEFLDRVVRGSGTATSSTNLFGAPTLRFNDGAADNDAGLMSLDGVPEASIRLGFSISGQAKDLPTDRLPEQFTFNPPPGGASHTFVIADESGSMLLQFRSFRQVRPEIVSIQRTGDAVEIIWTSEKGKPYALEFSTDLRQWAILRSDLIGLPGQTTTVDSLGLRYPNGPPPTGFYRILDRPAW
ncbi:MAG: hypothetical protein ACO3JG_10875 [Luteolibacter sp.]